MYTAKPDQEDTSQDTSIPTKEIKQQTTADTQSDEKRWLKLLDMVNTNNLDGLKALCDSGKGPQRLEEVQNLIEIADGLKAHGFKVDPIIRYLIDYDVSRLKTPDETKQNKTTPLDKDAKPLRIKTQGLDEKDLTDTNFRLFNLKARMELDFYTFIDELLGIKLTSAEKEQLMNHASLILADNPEQLTLVCETLYASDHSTSSSSNSSSSSSSSSSSGAFQSATSSSTPSLSALTSRSPSAASAPILASQSRDTLLPKPPSRDASISASKTSEGTLSLK